MTDHRVEPDIEAAAVLHLRATAAVTALVAVDDIATKLRSTWQAGTSAVRVRRIGGIPTEISASHLIRIRLQVEAFAGDEGAAFALAQQVDLALRGMPAAAHAGAVVTSVAKDLGLTNSPDPDSDSARYLFGVAVHAHGIA